MAIWVATGSKHGATHGIGRAVAERLAHHGFEASAHDADGFSPPADAEAFVLGSALYAGRWRKEAMGLLEGLVDRGAGPGWIFSSGPLGEPPQPEEARPEDAVLELAERAGYPHRVFSGKLDAGGLGFGERMMVRALKAPEDDFSDWDAIAGWAESIAAELAGG